MHKSLLYWFIFFTALSSCGTQKKALTGGEIIVEPAGVVVASPITSKKVDHNESLRIKYATTLNIGVEKISNVKLYRFIDNWLGTPYKWGGTDRRGIDCSAFVQRILDTAYAIKISRTSDQQFLEDAVNRFASTKSLAEGDLVFFQTTGKKIVTHVGMYLHNGIFVNSSSSRGVSLASLNDPYWKSRYVGAGRVNISLLTNYQR